MLHISHFFLKGKTGLESKQEAEQLIA